MTTTTTTTTRISGFRPTGAAVLFLSIIMSCLWCGSQAYRPSSVWSRLPLQQRSSNSALQLLPVDRLMLLSEKDPKRKRDVVLKPWRRTRSTLGMRHHDDNDKTNPNPNEDDNDQAVVSSSSSLSSNNSNSTILLLGMPLPLTLPPVVTQKVQLAWTAFKEFVDHIKFWLLSFLAGAVVTGAALLVPIYSQVQTLTQPVTLFETILHDLDQAYVDPVDTNKLFETGINAMLRSLDPYTEFEAKDEAVAMTESIEGRYGGVGLVIAGSTGRISNSNNNHAPPRLLPQPQQQPVVPPSDNNEKGNNKAIQQEGAQMQPPFKDGDISSSSAVPVAEASNPVDNNDSFQDDDDLDYMTLDQDEDDIDVEELRQRAKLAKQAADKGIRVVSAFEGYAFDYGMRVGDKLVAIDENPIGKGTSVEQVRNKLRGEPGTLVTIKFERDGVAGVQSVTMPRSLVRVRDVKLATLLGNPANGIGYIQLSGFASDTGREMRQAIQYLQRAAEDASNGERPLQGLVLDLRGNPGGLLTSAVDVCSLLVPKGSDIVSAKGRGFPGILYRSRVDPILDAQTKLAVLVNGNTASAAEIVSGAVQDLDVGVVVGGDRTFGKGLVQNVESLPFDTALKFTVAKYYTPSGRCIQGVSYKEGGGNKVEDPKYVASKIAEKDRNEFYTRTGRIVRDGGGVEADFKVQAPKASALEITLLRSGVLNEFAAEWSKTHELTNNFEVDEDTYTKFRSFVAEKQRKGELELESLYSKPLSDLKRSLKLSGYIGAEKSVEQLQARIVRDIQNDFQKYRNDIKEDISQSILARYLPESMLLERGVRSDVQVQAAVKLLSNDKQFDKLLARGSAASDSSLSSTAGNTLNMASSSSGTAGETARTLGKIEW